MEDKLQGEGATISQLLESDIGAECAKIRIFRGFLLGGKSLPERCLRGEEGQNPRWESVVPGSPGPQKEQACLRAAASPSVGKKAAISKPKSGLSS